MDGPKRRPKGVIRTVLMNANRHTSTHLFENAELEQLWREKYEFNKRELRLSDHKAKEWASRTIRAIEHSDAAGPDVQASAKS